MEGLMIKEGRELEMKTATSQRNVRIEEYRKRVSDEAYVDHAIRKIAADLSHYLTK